MKERPAGAWLRAAGGATALTAAIATTQKHKRFLQEEVVTGARPPTPGASAPLSPGPATSMLSPGTNGWPGVASVRPAPPAPGRGEPPRLPPPAFRCGRATSPAPVATAET